jgi:hypothetical protein
MTPTGLGVGLGRGLATAGALGAERVSVTVQLDAPMVLMK